MKYARVLLVLTCWLPLASASDSLPNVLWIYVDDMSDWVQCYGDTFARTPRIDELATDAVVFDRAFVPSPVCSTTRSAILTGTMQTTHGLHQHRTMIKRPLPEAVATVPELMRTAGYITFNEAKDDYNFLRDREEMYSAEFQRPGFRSHWKGRDASWLAQLQGKRFFGQIQLAGGKFGGETGNRYPADSRFDPLAVSVPPQYPDHPVIRNAIARHYEQIVETDQQVGAIIDQLKKYKLWDNTVVFFFTDHGCPLPRSKQFVYDEGLRVPLIVRIPEPWRTRISPASRRKDLVNCIDVAATTLGLANLPVPKNWESQDLFARDFHARSYVVGARDRLGIAVDRIRTIRTEHFRYIRNYKTDRALYQPQYRQEYATFRTLRSLLKTDKLSDLQASFHSADERPQEELYDLRTDPHEVRNLAKDSRYADVLSSHQKQLRDWISNTGDLGQYPEKPESLKAVFDHAKGNVEAPEFDFLRND